ncbi:MAG TPA: GNAT family N-acetyltransferase [Gammaproteobacteria bacterium]|jgi:GNAT superfamily N-acetyltransferase|nr:GNAT family N-acetyltransferase [Gammaproteobacteria bacterium]
MITPISPDTLKDILPLIRDYQTFYQIADISDALNATFFAQFGEHSPLGCQFAYRDDGQAVAFATVYLTFASTIAAKVAVLNDLYTTPDCRGKGIGQQLIAHCRQYAKGQGAVRLQWITGIDNVHAQQLYDKLDTHKRAWYFYTCTTES